MLTNLERISYLSIKELAKLLVENTYIYDTYGDVTDMYVSINGCKYYDFEDAVDENINWLKDECDEQKFTEIINSRT